MNLLTQEEAARLLRCSISKVERLRRDGALPYIPGRPVKVELADLLAYVEQTRVWSSTKRGPKRRSGDIAANGGRRAALKLRLTSKR